MIVFYQHPPFFFLLKSYAESAKAPSRRKACHQSPIFACKDHDFQLLTIKLASSRIHWSNGHRASDLKWALPREVVLSLVGLLCCRGTSGIDIDLRRVDIDQCPQRRNSSDVNIFAGSDKCKERTTQVSALADRLMTS